MTGSSQACCHSHMYGIVLHMYIIEYITGILFSLCDRS